MKLVANEGIQIMENADGVVKFIDTTHGREVYIFAAQVMAVTYLPTFKSTVIMGPGSTSIPVTATVEEAITAIKRALKGGQ